MSYFLLIRDHHVHIVVEHNEIQHPLIINYSKTTSQIFLIFLHKDKYKRFKDKYKKN